MHGALASSLPGRFGIRAATPRWTWGRRQKQRRFLAGPPPRKAEPHPGSKELIAILHRSHWLGTAKIKLEPGSLAARERAKIISLVILPLTVGRRSDGWLEGFEMHTNEETEQHSPPNISNRDPFANNCMQYFLFFGRTPVANLVGECFFGVEAKDHIVTITPLFTKGHSRTKQFSGRSYRIITRIPEVSRSSQAFVPIPRIDSVWVPLGPVFRRTAEQGM